MPEIRALAELGSGIRAPALPCLLLLCAFLLSGVAGMTVPTSLIDTKLLGKPKVYSGNWTEWNQFKFVFKSYV